MPMTLTQLRQNGQFRALDMNTQLSVAQRIWMREMTQNQQFMQLDTQRQEKVLKDLTMQSATFEDEQLGEFLRQTGTNYANGVAGAAVDKAGYEVLESTLRASGIAGGLGLVFGGSAGQVRRQDRERALQYFNAVESISGRKDVWSSIGGALGFVGDIVAVNTLMAPAVGAAAKAVQAAARGIKATEAATMTTEALMAAPLLHSKLAFYGPIAAESLVEAIPYFYVEEARRASTGQPTVISGGASEVAKVLGVSAAADFVVGSAASAFLELAGKSMGQVFKRGTQGKAIYSSEEEFQALLKEYRTGNLDRTVIDGLPEILQDRLWQSGRIAEFLDRGAAAPETYLQDRAALLANDLGEIWGMTNDGYRLWGFADKRPVAKTYQAFNDLENDLAYDFYKRYQALKPEEQALKIRPENEWAFKRGELLFKQTVKLEPEEWLTADPELASRWTMKPRSPRSRNIVTRSEATFLQGSSGPMTVVQADIPLGKDLLENARIHEFNLWRGRASVTVKPSDTPNAMFIGASEAPFDVYQRVMASTDEVLSLNEFKDPHEAVSSMMLNLGYDHVKLPDGSVEFFSTRGARLIGTPEDVLMSIRKPTATGDVATQVILNTVTTQHVTADAFGKSSDLVAHAAKKTLRSSDPQQYRDFARLYLGVDNADAFVRVIPTDAGKLTADVKDSVLTIRVPRKVASYEDELLGTRSLFEGLDAVGKIHNVRAKGLRSAEYIAKRIDAAPQKFGFPAGVDPVPWVDDVAATMGGKLSRNGSNYVLDLPSGTSEFTNAEDLVNYVAKRTLDRATVTNDLRMQGARLVKVRDDLYQVREHKTGKLLAEGSDMFVALDRLGYEPKHISNAYGPKSVRLTDKGLEFDIGKVRVTKNQAEAQQYIAKFMDNASLEQQTLLRAHKNGTAMQTPARQFEVYLSKYDVYKRFDNPGDATRFLTDDVKSLDELSEIAFKKGLDLSMSNGKYILRSRDSIMRASNLDELAAHFRKYPDIEHSARSILDDIDPDYEASVADVVAQYRDSRPMAGMNAFGLPPEFEFPERNPMSAWVSLQKSTEQFTYWMERMTKQINDPELLRKYRMVEHGARAADAETRKGLKMLDAMFRDSNGHRVSHESRQRILYTIGANTEDEVERLAQQYAASTGKVLTDLTPEEAAIAGKVKDYLRAMSVKFGIDFEKLIGNYMPRLRDLNAAANKGLINEMTVADELVGHLGLEAKEIKFWAEFERTDEFLKYALKDDALEVLMLYTTQGNKKLYMNDGWREMARYMKDTDLEKGITNRIDQYREALMGATRSPGEKAVEDFGERFMLGLKHNKVLGKFIKASDIEMADTGRELFRTIMGVNYISSMGWKPFLAIRNSLQPWSTAAPRLGPEWIYAGMKRVLKDPETYYAKHIELGVITDKPPIVHQGFKENSLGNRVSENALRWFKNSDDFTRSWVYESADMKFQNALDALSAGKIATRAQFEDLSGLDMMDQVLRDDTWRIISEGKNIDYRANALAKHNFALKFEEETMFPYRASESPTMYQGVVGKLFGQFGTYSVAFRANIARMFQNAPYAKRAEMVATYLGLSAAIWGTFAAMKIKTTDFIPFAPALFNGGPMFDLAFTSIAATDPGYEGAQARAKLKYTLPSLVPGSAQARYVKKFLEYQDQGDSYRAWLSLGGVPVYPD